MRNWDQSKCGAGFRAVLADDASQGVSHLGRPHSQTHPRFGLQYTGTAIQTFCMDTPGAATVCSPPSPASAFRSRALVNKCVQHDVELA